MSKKTRGLGRTALAGALLLGGAFSAAAGAAPVSAAEQQTNSPARVAAACYDTARYYTMTHGGSGNAHWPGTGKYAYTTGSCSDINVKPNSGRQVRVCFERTGTCNSWKYVPAGTWRAVATDVRDYTGFYVQFKGSHAESGYIAY